MKYKKIWKPILRDDLRYSKLFQDTIKILWYFFFIYSNNCNAICRKGLYHDLGVHAHRHHAWYGLLQKKLKHETTYGCYVIIVQGMRIILLSALQPKQRKGTNNENATRTSAKNLLPSGMQMVETNK